MPVFKSPEMCVTRRFSDFLGLYSKLHEKHTKTGLIVPPAPEKSVIGIEINMSGLGRGFCDCQLILMIIIQG